MEYPFKDLLPLDEVLEREGYYKDWTHLDPEVFYSLTQISEYIKTKGYGVDVRLLIAQLAEHFGLKTTQVIDLANLLQQQFTNLEGVTQSFTNNINSLVAQMEADKNAVIANATVDSEVILARGGEPTLGARLNEVDAQLAQTNTQLTQTTNKVGVSFEEFGAELDGVTDDTEAIKATFAYANEHQIPVIQRYSTFVLNDEVEVRTDVDLTGTVITSTLRDESPASYNRTMGLFKITDKELVDITDIVNKNELTKGTTSIPSLSNLGMSGTLIIKSNDLDLLRFDNDALSNVPLQDINIYQDNESGLLTYPLVKDFSNVNDLKVYIRLGSQPLTFNAPVFDVAKTKLYSLIKILRSNTVVLGGEMINEKPNENPVYAPLYYEDCSKLHIKGFSAKKVGNSKLTLTDRTGYFILFERAISIKIENVYNQHGWRGVDGNTFRDTTIENSKLRSCGGHANVYDMSISKSTIYRSVSAHGGGTLLIDDVVFVEGNNPSIDKPNMKINQLSNYAISTRGDYASEWDGDIIIKNAITFEPTMLFLLGSVKYDPGRAVTFPNIHISNVKMMTDLPSVVVRWDSYSEDADVYIPKYINIKNIETNGPDRHRTLDVPNVVHGINSDDTTILIEDCNIPYEKFKPDPYFIWDDANISLPYIKSDLTFIYKIKNSVANFNIKGTSNLDILIENSDTYFLMTDSESKMTTTGKSALFRFINSHIHGPSSSLGAFPSKIHTEISIENSEYSPFIDNMGKHSKIAINFGNLIVFSSGNRMRKEYDDVIKETPEKLFNYVDTNVYLN